MNEWRLSEQVAFHLHRWPLLLAFVLCGALAGLVIGWIWPAAYEARQEIFVGINALPQAHENPGLDSSYYQLRNLDDYKNWQMEQLDQFVYTDEVLLATLETLQSSNPAWAGLTTEDLRTVLGAEWRTAGRWQLAATHEIRALAEAAAAAWSAEVEKQTAQAVEQAREMLALDARRQASARARSELLTYQATRQELRNSLNAELEEMEGRQGETLDERSRQRLLALVGQAAGFTTAWQAALANFPEPQAPARAYSLWINDAIHLLQMDLDLGENQLDALETDLTATASAYQAAVQQSYGLSPNLVVEGIITPQPAVSVQRPTGELVALGAALGFLAWLLFALIQINREALA